MVTQLTVAFGCCVLIGVTLEDPTLPLKEWPWLVSCLFFSFKVTDESEMFLLCLSITRKAPYIFTTHLSTNELNLF